MNNHDIKYRAFSLLELAISIAIIASFMSVISIGQSIRKNAQLRQVVNDFYQYEALFDSFKERYGQYPGDMNNAHDFFGDDCDTNASECNGDGDGYIESGSAGDQQRENHRLWQHLNLAEMLPGNYPGYGGVSSATNSPVGPLASSIYFVDNTADFVDVDNKLFFTGSYTTYYEAILDVSGARSIDIKMDDGIAHKGVIYGISGVDVSATDCSAARATTPADYNMDSTVSRACYVAYRFDTLE